MFPFSLAFLAGVFKGECLLVLEAEKIGGLFFKISLLGLYAQGKSLLLLEARGMRGQGEIFLGIPRRYGVGREETSLVSIPMLEATGKIGSGLIDNVWQI